MQQVAAALGRHPAEEGHTQQSQVADYVENFVAHKLVFPAQTRFIQHAIPRQAVGVIELPAANQIRASQRFDFFDKSKRSRGSSLASKRTVIQSNRAMLQADQRMLKVDEAVDFISISGLNRNAAISSYCRDPFSNQQSAACGWLIHKAGAFDHFGECFG